MFRSPRRSFPLLAATTAVVALLAASCGSNDDADELGSAVADAPVGAAADGGDPDQTPDPDGPEVVAGADDGDSDGGLGDPAARDDNEEGDRGPAPESLTAADVVASPLGRFLGDDTYGAEWSPAAEERRRQAEAERQQFMVTCMAEAGFEYLPVESVGRGPGTGVRTVAAEQTRDWAQRWGFGISTTRFSQAEVGDGLVGHDGSGPVLGGDDPNLAVTSALSPADLERYFAALYGDEGGGGFEVAGCLGGAAASAAAASLAFYDEFGPELDALYTEIEADERLIEAEDRVRACVAGSGLDYLDSAERLRHFDAAVSGVVEAATHPSDALSDREMALLSAAEVDELMGQPRQLSAADRSTLAAIQAEEVALAVAVFDCGGGGLATAVLRSQVTAEYEERFLAEHADRLEPFRAS